MNPSDYRQYMELKAVAGAGVILLYRIGDFYETFGDDAEAVSKLCGVGIGRHSHPINPDSEPTVPMAGIPKTWLDHCLKRLVRAGERG